MDATPDIKAPNIYQRINEVRKKVAYIQKDAKVQGYKAITHDTVTSEVRPHLIANGIMVIPSEVSGELRDTGKASKAGTPFTVYVARYGVDFINMDDPEDRFTVNVGALAEDQNDKGPGKAISYATKYAMLKVFNIETGESEESRQEQKPMLITEDQQIEINDLISETGSNTDKFLQFLGAKSVETIPQNKYQQAINALKKKASK